MAQSEHSAEEIIKLGEKLISELHLDYTTDTLSRWMAHYLSELIVKIESCESEEAKVKLQEECCNLILKIWEKKDRLPIQKPLEGAKEFLKILRLIKKEENNTVSIIPRWIKYRSISGDSPWSNFVEKVKNNSEKIFYHSMEANLHKELLLKDNEWLENHEEFLSDEEKELIRHLNSMAKIDFSSGVVDMNDYPKKNVSREERLNYIFDEIEKLIEEEKTQFQKLKDQIFNKLNEDET
ncbi:hypothetical protein [Kordia sp.]|uniref:hypothetical protein n=1 Tax=Kordia sp. TaxID=1965332 RepID=UPI003B5B785B